MLDLCLINVASLGLSFKFKGSKTGRESLLGRDLCLLEISSFLLGFKILFLHNGLVHLGFLQEQRDTMIPAGLGCFAVI